MKGWARSFGIVLGLLLLVAIVPVGAQVPAIPATIKVGALFDLTGITSDVGKDYSVGVLDHVRYINEVQGGIRGKVKIDLVWSDYGYRIPDAVALYRKYVGVDKVQAIVGWGTGDTEAMKELITTDQIPYISASYSSHLNDPSKTPYNFYPVSSYSDQIRAVLKFARDLAQRDGIQKPKFVFIYPSTGYGKAPIPAGQAYAKELGFDVGPDQIVEGGALEARAQVAAVRTFGADFAWFGGTTNSASITVRDARQAGLRTRFFVNVWGFDESMIRLIGATAEGVYGSTPHAYYGEPVPGMRTLFDVYRRFQGKEVPQFDWGTTKTPYIASYIRGWLNVYMLRKALELMVDNWASYRSFEGFQIRSALELLRNWDPDGLAPPVTVTREDHRPSTTTRIVQIRNGRMQIVQVVTVEKRKEWMGF